MFFPLLLLPYLRYYQLVYLILSFLLLNPPSYPLSFADQKLSASYHLLETVPEYEYHKQKLRQQQTHNLYKQGS